MKRLFIGGLVLAVFATAGVLLLVLRSSDGEREPLVQPQHAAATAASPVSSDLEGVAPRVDVERTKIADPGSRTAIEPPKGAIHVIVVDRATQARLAGATVSYGADVDMLAHRDPRRSWIGGLEETLAAHGATTLTNDEGEAWITPRERPATVCARHAGLWNFRAIPVQGEGTLTLELVPDRSVVLKVVDSTGRPQAGVPVAIFSTSGQGFTFSVWEDFTSAPDGTATVRHFDPLLESVARRQQLSAGFAFLLAEPRDVPIDPASLPKDPIELVLPPVGAVDVTLAVADRYASSLRSTLAGEVWLEDADPKPPRGVFIQKTQARDGRAKFTHVGLDLNLVVKAKNVSGFKPAAERGPGPHVIGETAEFTIRFDDPYPTLVGRLVNAAGAPLGNRALRGRTEVRTEEGPVSAATLPASSDAQGAVHVVLQLLPLPGLDGHAQLQVYGADQVLEGYAVVPLPAFLQRGDNVVGDIVVEKVERLVAGVVLDEKGAPLAGVWVHVQRGEVRDASQATSGRDAILGDGAPQSNRVPPSFTEGGGGALTRWLSVSGLQAETDRDGAFVVLGSRPQGLTRVVVSHEGYLRAEGPEFAPGRSDVVIHLQRAGMIRGSLITPEYFPLDALSTLVTPAADSASGIVVASKQRVAPVLLNREFEAPALAAGTYTVDVLLKGDPKPLVSFAGVVVRAGETADDPRLAGIDLRNEVRCLRIEVVDRDGAPISNATVSTGHGTPQQRSFKANGKEVRVVVRDEAVDLDVTATGYRPVSIRRVSSDRRVVLEPRLDVELALAPGVRPPARPFYLGLKFIPIRSDADVIESARSHEGEAPLANDRLFDVEGDLYFDETGWLRAKLPAAGSFRLEWSITYTEGGVGAGSTLPPFEHDRIDVAEVPGTQYFEVAPDAAQLERVLRDMQKSWDGKK